MSRPANPAVNDRSHIEIWWSRAGPARSGIAAFFGRAIFTAAAVSK
jgi:hypothetical protein